MKNLRLLLPVMALAALISAGCFMVSGQFIITVAFSDYGLDPLVVTDLGSSPAVPRVPVDLTKVAAYKDHKGELKDVSDIALVGDFKNLSTTAPLDLEVWMVANPTAAYTTTADVRTNGQRIWGPLHVGVLATNHVGWDASAKLFSGRAALISEIKGDGRFDLYVIGTVPYSLQVNRGALIAVIAAGK